MAEQVFDRTSAAGVRRLPLSSRRTPEGYTRISNEIWRKHIYIPLAVFYG